LSALLQARGKAALAFWALLLGLGLGLAIEVPLAQSMGARGASWSRVVGGAVQALLAGFFVWRMLAKETAPVATQIQAKNTATG
jgi:O-antigen/teichoic acid export membrane protein